MKTRIRVRPVRDNDTPELAKYMLQTPNNLFDPAVLSYPMTSTFLAHNGKSIVYMPVQIVPMLESLAINPEAAKHEVAVGLKEIMEAVELLSHQQGYGEIYFICKDESTSAFAMKHGFEELPWKTYRFKIYEEDSNNGTTSTESVSPSGS